MSTAQNTFKAALRLKVKDVLLKLSVDSKKAQSDAITNTILKSEAFKQSKRISVYLSMANEVDTQQILYEMFRQHKEVFVPSYSGHQMVMLKINDIDDLTSLPLTKWNIRQPDNDGSREDAFDAGGLDLILLPGVAFSLDGGRMGHGMGYYDKFLATFFDKYPQRKGDRTENIQSKVSNGKTILFGLAFKEQIFDKIPITDTDAMLDQIITAA